MLAHAAAADVHDERLWLKVAEATGAPGNTSCLVGTAEQVADSLLKYYELGGLDYVLIRGFDPLADALEFGDELIPRLKAGALAIDERVLDRATAGQSSAGQSGVGHSSSGHSSN